MNKRNQFVKRAPFLTALCVLAISTLGGCDQGADTTADTSPHETGAELSFVEKAVRNVVSSDVAYRLRQQGEDIAFVSVCEPESIALSGGNVIRGSKVIPLSDFVKNLDQIDCAKNTILVCEGTFDGGECSVSPAAGTIIIDRLGCKAGHIKYLLESFGAWQAAGCPSSYKLAQLGV